MKRLGGWQLGVSLFSVDLNNNLVDFVRYVDSYPILSSGKEGFTQIKGQYEWHRENENLITDCTNTITNEK